MSVFDSKELKELIIKEAIYSREVFIASAFITDVAVEWLESVLPIGASVHIVLRGKPSDFINGASSISALKKIYSLGWQLGFNENLHTKIYMFDSKTIFVGSANLTSNGLMLSSVGNIEANTQVCVDEATLRFIRALKDSAIRLDSDVIELMDVYINEHVDNSINQDKMLWPQQILDEPISELFISDFPTQSYGKNRSEQGKFAVIDVLIAEANKEEALRVFKSLRLTRWFIKQLKEYGDIRYGHLSKLLHSYLVEDPRVYRKDLKVMQSNFLEYVEELLSEVESLQPNHTKLYKLKS